MARVQNTLIGRASGSVDNVTFLTIFRKNVIRAKMSHQTNPNTALQQQQRNKFGYIVELYRLLKPILIIGLKNRNRKMTIFNFFQYLNQQNAFTNLGGGAIQFNPEALKISYGLIPVTPIADLFFFSGTNDVGVLTNLELGPGQSYTDSFIIVAFNETQQKWAISNQVYTRPADFKVIELPTDMEVGDIINVWLYSINNSTGLLSDTSFFSKEVTV